MSSQEQSQQIGDARLGWGLLWMAMLGLAFTAEVFLRRKMGEQAVRRDVFLAGFVMICLFTAGLSAPDTPVPVEVRDGSGAVMGVRHVDPASYEQARDLLPPQMRQAVPARSNVHSAVPLWWFGILYGWAGAWQWVVARKATARGPVWHSRHSGESRLQALLARLGLRLSEGAAKQYAELLFCMALGVGLGVLLHNQPLGVFLFVAGLALGIKEGEVERRDQVILQRMRDARAEQEYYAERDREEVR
jgi:hypothetical protein